MKKSMKISLKAGERIYINGAVLKADRKVSLELLNDATFLLEHHVMKPEETSTPLRQLYFIVQTMIMDPDRHNPAHGMCTRMLRDLLEGFRSDEVRAGLLTVGDLISKDRNFDALREIRNLLPIELKVLAPVNTATIDHQETASADWNDGKQHANDNRNQRARA
jgi:flagellar protein FlbT